MMKIKIDRKSVINLKNWFSIYLVNFNSDDPELQRNIKLKTDHTKRVVTEILDLGKALGLNSDELNFAEIIALLHDIGRFEQYARYKTFMDRKSEDHARLGIKILTANDVLNEFDGFIKDLIFRTILYHNRAALPVNETETCLFFTKLLRDADKLDILKVVTDYYHQNDGKRNGAIGLDLPDTPGISEEVYLDLMDNKIVDIRHVKNLNDFKLLQVGWIFDINFDITIQAIKLRGYLEMLKDVLPKSEKIQMIFEHISNDDLRR
ncbi:HD domain-containing protein [candidate division KSB1 bacterium]|nr:HD domain-containing protein [candidate division KSB1 bacterium]